MRASSPMPHPTIPAPRISKPSRVPSDAVSSSVAASLARRERPESVTRRRTVGDINRMDRDDVDRTDTPSSSSRWADSSARLGMLWLSAATPPVPPIAPGSEGAGEEGRGGSDGACDDAGVCVCSSVWEAELLDASSRGSASTSSASRYHFRRRVQRDQPTRPQQPNNHNTHKQTENRTRNQTREP